MSKTIFTVIIAVTIIAAVSYGFYAYTRPVVAPTMTNTNTNVTTNSNGVVNTENETQTKIYLVALEDDGKSGIKVGCGDSLVAVDVSTPSEVVDASGLTSLLDIKDKTYGQSGLYNALYQSDLTVDSITYNDNNTKIIVALSGNIVSGGTCDGPRIQNQLVETVKAQDSAITTVEITVDGVALDKVLSGAGE